VITKKIILSGSVTFILALIKSYLYPHVSGISPDDAFRSAIGLSKSSAVAANWSLAGTLFVVFLLSGSCVGRANLVRYS
jgi:hypothetical protein